MASFCRLSSSLSSWLFSPTFSLDSFSSVHFREELLISSFSTSGSLSPKLPQTSSLTISPVKVKFRVRVSCLGLEVLNSWFYCLPLLELILLPPSCSISFTLILTVKVKIRLGSLFLY